MSHLSIGLGIRPDEATTRNNSCYGSVADSEFALMAETMAASARKAGVTMEFHIWSDRKIAGAGIVWEDFQG